MAIPQFVRDFCARRVGERVALIRFVSGFTGTIEDAEPVGKRVRYKVRTDTGELRTVFADEPGVAHIGPKMPEAIRG